MNIKICFNLRNTKKLKMTLENLKDVRSDN